MNPNAAPTIVALGSNLGDRHAHMIAGLEGLATLPQSSVTGVSPLYETAPVGGPDNQGPYLNAAAVLWTELPPAELLKALHEVEASRQRERQIRWGPRTLDLDLLIYGDVVANDPHLCLPHPRMHERRFVIVPVSDIAPDVVHPALGRTMKELAATLPVEPGDLTVFSENWVPASAATARSR